VLTTCLRNSSIFLNGVNGKSQGNRFVTSEPALHFALSLSCSVPHRGKGVKLRM